MAPKSLVEFVGASFIKKAVEILLMGEDLAPPEKYYRFLGFHIQLSKYNTEKFLREIQVLYSEFSKLNIRNIKGPTRA